MRIQWPAVFLGTAAFAVIGVAAVTARADEEGDEAVDWTARAKQAWTSTCQKCHTVPDTQFESDRAFLDQIKETS